LTSKKITKTTRVRKRTPELGEKWKLVPKVEQYKKLLMGSRVYQWGRSAGG